MFSVITKLFVFASFLLISPDRNWDRKLTQTLPNQVSGSLYTSDVRDVRKVTHKTAHNENASVRHRKAKESTCEQAILSVDKKQADTSSPPVDFSLTEAKRANDIALNAYKWNRFGIILLALTLIATFTAAYAASRSTSIAQDLLNGVNRPYLVVEYVDANFEGVDVPQNYLAIRHRIKNIGGSPAIIDTFHHQLSFEPLALPESATGWLGGSNIHVIEKDGYSQTFTCYSNISAEEFRTRLVTEGKTLTWRVNFSYTDLLHRRRNQYFTNYYSAPPFSSFRSNLPDRVVDVALNPYKWHQRRNLIKAKYYNSKYWLFPWTKPKMMR